MTEITTVKQRFGIIGNSPLLDRALEVALRVAPTDLTVLVTGESGVGKEFFPQVIHAYSARKHSKYIAVNCAAIPEGTIDSELFGHEKGSFTGAVEARKGYFEEADGGTIFLDEVAELPHPTQARLLRVLQTGEYIRVGSSKVQKTNVRVVAATNMNLQEAIAQGRFREDLYYRLGTVPITVPSLRERPEDIPLLFRKFAADVAVQYRMPAVTLDDAAREMLKNYYWRGNIRQLKNVAEQISAIEQTRVITSEVLAKYLPPQGGGAPMAAGTMRMDDTMSTERELLYKVLFDMRADINDLKPPGACPATPSARSRRWSRSGRGGNRPLPWPLPPAVGFPGRWCHSRSAPPALPALPLSFWSPCSSPFFYNEFNRVRSSSDRFSTSRLVSTYCSCSCIWYR